MLLYHLRNAQGYFCNGYGEGRQADPFGAEQTSELGNTCIKLITGRLIRFAEGYRHGVKYRISRISLQTISVF